MLEQLFGYMMDNENTYIQRQTDLFKLKDGIIVKEVDNSHILKYSKDDKFLYFKTSPKTKHLIQSLQKGISLHEIVTDNDEKNVALEIQIIVKLKSLGLLEGFESAGESKKGKEKIGKFIGYLLLPLGLTLFQFNPERVLSWLYNTLRLRFIYTSVFIITAFILSSIMAIVLLAKGYLTFRPVFTDHTTLTIIGIYSVVIIGIFVHELAHCITCTHWGAKVRSMGFMLYYLMPAAFSDVSDSYILDRFKRISVMAAGPLTNAFIGIWLGGLWLISEKGSVFGNLCHFFSMFSLISTLYGLNPLLKYDGYYILSELVGKENLRKQSRIFLFKVVKSLFAPHIASTGLSRKDTLVYLIYGISSSIYSVFFLFVISRFLISLLKSAFF